MENYLRELYQRLTAIGADRRTALRGVEIARTWLQRAIAGGTPEAEAIARHRREEMPGLLAGARNITTTTRMLGVRTPPPAPTPAPDPAPDPEKSLRQMIEHLREMEAEGTIREIQRDFPGGGIATPLAQAQGQSMARFLGMYGPVATFLIQLTPVIGDAIDLAEAALGRDMFTGETLSESDRALRAGFGIVGLITVAGRVVGGLARGTASVVRGVSRASRAAGTTAEALTQSFRQFARFARYRPRITRILSKLQNGVTMSSAEIALLRLFFERLQAHFRLIRGATLAAVEASGRVLRRLVSRSGAAIRVVNANGTLKFFRCMGT